MSQPFDPYLKWLGIPPKHQPPNDYRLLGIELFESDTDVIANAADQRMVHVKSYAAGKYSDLSQRILNEIAAARVRLLSAEQKVKYDGALREELKDKVPAVVTAVPAARRPAQRAAGELPAAVAAAEPEAEPEVVELPFAVVEAGPHPASRPAAPVSRHRSNRMWLLGGAAALAVSIVGIIIALLVTGPNKNEGAIAAGTSEGTTENPGEQPGAKPTPSHDPESPAEKPKPDPVVDVHKPDPVVPEPMEKPAENPVSPAEKPAEKPTKPPKDPREKPEEFWEPTNPREVTKPPEPAKPPEPVKKLPEPDGTAQKKSESEIKEIYQDKVRDAKTPQLKLALAGDLVRDARGTKDSAVAPYVLLRMAADLHVEADDLDGAMSVLDQIGSQYEVGLLELKSGVLTKAVKVAEKHVGDDAMNQRIVDSANRLVEEALAEGQLDIATRSLGQALTSARRMKAKQLMASIQNRVKDMERLLPQFELFKKALDALAKDPKNPKANVAAGTWYCLVAGNWEKGIPCLAKGDDKDLAEIAGEELKNPRDSEQQAALGDHWWTLAESRKGIEARRMQSRAAEWYKKALASPSLQGLARAKLEKRIEGQGLSIVPFALKFDGKSSYGVVKNFGYTGNSPISIEAVVKPDRHPRAESSVGGTYFGYPQGIFGNVARGTGLMLGTDYNYWRARLYYRYSTSALSTSDLYTMSNTRVLPDKWFHVALVCDGKELRVYVNGHMEGSSTINYPHAPSPAPFVIGAEPTTTSSPTGDALHGFCGLMRGIRVCSTAVYTKDFTPPMELRSETGTVLLFPMNEGKGNTLRDASGHSKMVAELTSCEWVKLDREPRLDGGSSPGSSPFPPPRSSPPSSPPPVPKKDRPFK